MRAASVPTMLTSSSNNHVMGFMLGRSMIEQDWDQFSLSRKTDQIFTCYDAFFVYHHHCLSSARAYRSQVCRAQMSIGPARGLQLYPSGRLHTQVKTHLP